MTKAIFVCVGGVPQQFRNCPWFGSIFSSNPACLGRPGNGLGGCGSNFVQGGSNIVHAGDNFFHAGNNSLPPDSNSLPPELNFLRSGPNLFRSGNNSLRSGNNSVCQGSNWAGLGLNIFRLEQNFVRLGLNIFRLGVNNFRTENTSSRAEDIESKPEDRASGAQYTPSKADQVISTSKIHLPRRTKLCPSRGKLLPTRTQLFPRRKILFPSRKKYCASRPHWLPEAILPVFAPQTPFSALQPPRPVRPPAPKSLAQSRWSRRQEAPSGPQLGPRGRKMAPACSADFPSAVAPNCIRQTLGFFQRLRIPNPRYSRMQFCATNQRRTATLGSLGFLEFMPARCPVVARGPEGQGRARSRLLTAASSRPPTGSAQPAWSTPFVQTNTATSNHEIWTRNHSLGMARMTGANRCFGTPAARPGMVSCPQP